MYPRIHVSDDGNLSNSLLASRETQSYQPWRLLPASRVCESVRMPAHVNVGQVLDVRTHDASMIGINLLLSKAEKFVIEITRIEYLSGGIDMRHATLRE